LDNEGRIKTYVQGFDDILEGGIPPGHVVLLSGTPGSMKSSLGFYVLYNQVKHEGRTALYVTLEQSRESLIRQMARMEMDIEDVKQNLHVLDLGILRKRLNEISNQGSWMQVFKTYLSNLKGSLGFDLIVVDSLDVLETMAGITHRRTELFYLFEWLRDLGCTVLLISELTQEKMLNGASDEGYLSDGIISLKMHLVREVEIQRRVRCLKMRETAHDPSYFSLLFNDGRFQITKVISE
jgi:KaiC/GvpD/RAD55 family RecA-like ATPase